MLHGFAFFLKVINLQPWPYNDFECNVKNPVKVVTNPDLLLVIMILISSPASQMDIK
jgi:hypothetical protein